MENPETEKPHCDYGKVYKGVYRRHELEKTVVWRECLNCNKEFPGERYVRICHTCHLRMKGLDQSVYKYEID